ncbi:MAG: hypothetical protein E7663_02510 [Ruminococcaceae bacterium]|nr:hypothetical protein [Oscillospiraceae bacterium]
MYIQSGTSSGTLHDGDSPPVIPPKGYSGNAFRRQETVPESPPASAENEVEAPPSAIPSDTDLHAPPPRQDTEGKEEGTAPVGGRVSSGGILSRFPFLSSLFPPPRHPKERQRESSLLEWLPIILFVLFTLDEREDHDILPILLLLLLWD